MRAVWASVGVVERVCRGTSCSFCRRDGLNFRKSKKGRYDLFHIVLNKSDR